MDNGKQQTATKRGLGLTWIFLIIVFTKRADGFDTEIDNTLFAGVELTFRDNKKIYEDNDDLFERNHEDESRHLTFEQQGQQNELQLHAYTICLDTLGSALVTASWMVPGFRRKIGMIEFHVTSLFILWQFVLKLF